MEIKEMRFLMARSLVKKMLDSYQYVVFTNTDLIPKDLKRLDFSTLNISGPIFRTIVDCRFSNVIRGRMFLVGTNSFNAFEKYIDKSKNSIVFLRWSITPDKNYMMTTFDFENVLKSERFDPNVLDVSFYFN